MKIERKSIHLYPAPVTDDLVLEGMVNDALGTIDPADSTGIDEDMETGDAKDQNFPTRED